MNAAHRPSGPRVSACRASAVLLLAVWAPGCDSGTGELSSSAPEGAPNVLFVTIDTLRADHLGCYGYDRPTSPNLDALAEGGVLFERAYAHAPFTAPSHASLLTSLHPETHGVLAWEESLDPEARTLGERLAERGWRTGAFHNHPGLVRSDVTRGFDEVQARFFCPAEDTVDAFYEWLDAGTGAWGAWVHLWDVHRPYGYRDWSGDWVPEEMKREPSPYAFAEQRFGEAPGGDVTIGRTEAFYNLNAERRAQPVRTASRERKLNARDFHYIANRYDGGVAEADRGLGLLLEGLRERGLEANTLVVVTADHGESLLEREACYFTHDPFLYEETLHVPLVMRLPSGAHAGLRVASLARGVDVLPTMLEVLDIPPRLTGRFRDQGRSLMPAVRGEPQRASLLYASTRTKNAKEHKRKADAETPWLEHREAVSDGRWKLVHDVGSSSWALFDLETDPGELTNLSGKREHAERLAALRTRLEALQENLPRSGQESRGLSDEERRTMAGLGYVDPDQ